MQKEMLKPFALYYGRICTFYISELKKCSGLIFACYDVNKTGSCVSPNEKSNICYHIWSENKNTHFSINVQYIDKLYFWGFVIYTKCGMICNHNIKEWYTVSLKKVYASLNTDNYFFLVQMISKLILVQRKPGE